MALFPFCSIIVLMQVLMVSAASLQLHLWYWQRATNPPSLPALWRSCLKVLLICNELRPAADSMLALAEDHRNDIISNLGAIAFGAIASSSQKVWWFDPVGAILISAYIIWSWACILKGQVYTLTPLHYASLGQIDWKTHSQHGTRSPFGYRSALAAINYAIVTAVSRRKAQ